jgi:beta-galactosidase GanA
MLHEQQQKTSMRINILEWKQVREYTMFESAQVLLNWREQRPSNEDDLDSSVTGTDLLRI